VIENRKEFFYIGVMGPYDGHKKAVLDASLWLMEHGFFGSKRGTGGNVSVRIDASAMAITPSSVKYQDLSAEDICIVGLKDLSVIEGKLAPSVESGMHSAIYRTRPDVHAVAHTHQLYGSVFSLINEPIPALFEEVALSLGAVVEVVPYARYGSADLSRNVAGRLSNNANAYIIQNHGILALGKDLDTALLHTDLLEKAAQSYCLALATGKKVNALPQDIIDTVKAARDQEVSEAAKKAKG
jgi:ribulose-5-phosphate 4-epimerase/fuculose-1-phosphate aldolase